MKILIVDDNATVRRLIRHVIGELKIIDEIYECSDGDQALSVYLEMKPDLVLMDIRMPRMDGLSATKSLRKANPSVRVIIVTDYDDTEIREAAYEAGACGYALKQDLTSLEGLIDRELSEHNRSSD